MQFSSVATCGNYRIPGSCEGREGCSFFQFYRIKACIEANGWPFNEHTARNPRIDLQGTDFKRVLYTRLDIRECTSTQSVPLDGLLGGF